MIPPRIKSVRPLNKFHLEIIYETNEKKIYDMDYLLKMDCYKKLRDVNYFNRVKSAGTTVEWPDGEDVDPNELYENSLIVN